MASVPERHGPYMGGERPGADIALSRAKACARVGVWNICCSHFISQL